MECACPKIDTAGWTSVTPATVRPMSPILIAPRLGSRVFFPTEAKIVSLRFQKRSMGNMWLAEMGVLPWQRLAGRHIRPVQGEASVL